MQKKMENEMETGILYGIIGGKGFLELGLGFRVLGFRV